MRQYTHRVNEGHIVETEEEYGDDQSNDSSREGDECDATKVSNMT
jgi:hypothetical protein